LWRKDIQLRVDERRQKVEIDVRRTGELEFVIRRPGGAPAAGALVELHSVEFDTNVADWVAAGLVAGAERGLVTDGEGRIRLRGLPHGSYRWSCAGASGAASVPPNALASEAIQLAD
jgi:hypothetical protein